MITFNNQHWGFSFFLYSETSTSKDRHLKISPDLVSLHSPGLSNRIKHQLSVGSLMSTLYWLVVQFRHLEKWWSSSMGRMTTHINEMDNKKCLKPPTSLLIQSPLLVIESSCWFEHLSFCAEQCWPLKSLTKTHSKLQTKIIISRDINSNKSNK